MHCHVLLYPHYWIVVSLDLLKSKKENTEATAMVVAEEEENNDDKGEKENNKAATTPPPPPEIIDPLPTLRHRDYMVSTDTVQCRFFQYTQWLCVWTKMYIGTCILSYSYLYNSSIAK